MATKERLIIENLFRVVDKDGGDVDFIMNPAQASIDHTLTGRDIIPKARQEGVSTYFLARYTVKCLSQRNTRAVVISHDKEATQRMLAKVHYFLDNIRGPDPVLKTSSRNEITFPKTNSAFYLGTAGSRQFGRGDTITHLHCSEVAYWPDPKSLTAGLFQAVPKNGEIALESTGNGVGNWYHNICTRAAESKGRYKLHFLDWLSFPEYTLHLTAEQEREVLATLDKDYEEDLLVEAYGATAGQIAWRRYKLEELDYDIRTFKQEYPATLDECFQSSGYSIFTKINFVPTDKWKRRDANLHSIEDHPQPQYDYAFGVDVSAGVGRDNSVMQIYCLQTMEQVGEWVSNRISPDIFAEHIDMLGRRFNEAYVTVESNNHGLVVLDNLKRLRYPAHKIFKHKQKQAEGADPLMSMGHPTTAKSKPMMIGKLRSLLAAPPMTEVDSLTIHSPMLSSELSTFVEKPDGSLEAEEGCMDDRVMAAAVGTMGLTRAMLQIEDKSPRPEKGKDPFAMAEIINEMRGRDSGYPIGSQAAIGLNGHEIFIP